MEKENLAKKIEQRFKGIVVSIAGDKTIIVVIKRAKVHSKYLKRFTVTKKYKVHDPKNQYRVGDEVTFIGCRPISKDKRWRVLYN